jgi:hypothetical protein
MRTVKLHWNGGNIFENGKIILDGGIQPDLDVEIQKNPNTNNSERSKNSG